MVTENKIKYFENRGDWRRWPMDNFETEDEILFVFPLKSSGEKSIIYNDAVEEVLCFKWVDSMVKPLDEKYRVQRFTLRRPKSTYSQANKKRLKWLLANKMIHPGFGDKIRTTLSDPSIFPSDVMDRLREDEMAWKNYRHFSDAYKCIRTAYAEAARKQPGEFEKRLSNFIYKVKENKMITGFGGVEKYY